MPAYYNENDPFAAQWLRNLIAAGHIAPGYVDERSIADVEAKELNRYLQCHFFAGIGGWSFALRLAGWPDERRVWTGSCPCQSLSSAGKRKGHADERHLWPAFHDLIAQRRPAIVFGEQVASADGREWLAAVRADLEALGYACGAAGLCAAGIGAPHLRQRLWWVADATGAGSLPGAHSGISGEETSATPQCGRNARRSAGHSGAGELGAAERAGLEKQLGNDGISSSAFRAGARQAVERTSGMGDANGGREATRGEVSGRSIIECSRSPWAEAEWIDCRDGKRRPVEPGTFPLATGIPSRMGRLRAFGNAIVPQVAAEFIGAFMECQP